MSEEKAWSFEKTWHYQQGALFLKEENSSLEWKKNLAEYFFRHGTVKGQELGIEQMQQELTDLKAKYEKAVNCLRRAQKIIRDDFHNSVCLKSMGCHCKDNFIDEVIAELGEKE